MTLISKEDENQDWTRLTETDRKFFFCGALLRFRLADRQHIWHYVLFCSIDQSKQLSAIDLDGQTWGHGRCELPESSYFQNRPYTVSIGWLLNNFGAIARTTDTKDIWFCLDFAPNPILVDKVEGDFNDGWNEDENNNGS